ncbi:hypothetical protein [Actinomadura opuntiae]|uniref:hypothetical protein n=1 Tax=Actinomadura sp. OS1-43 TaxID=604315 RepID=UPI00255AB0B7|nr:hypothetical protein [Actinomadura sp. OS1-43]MDL4815254.1 hypothetical protein [Actinomadura sp. OS1-43]
MTVFLVFVVIAVVIVVVAVVALVAWTMRRRARLRGQFGPEYDRTVGAVGNRREAERQLVSRRNHVEHMDLRPLDPSARKAYHAEWARLQERFVDAPEDALSGADRLIRRVMADRGYGTPGYEQRVADLSVGHSRALDHYRKAHRVSARAAGKDASTEDLRQATMHYWALFEELLDGDAARTAPSTACAGGDSRHGTANDHTNTPKDG